MKWCLSDSRFLNPRYSITCSFEQCQYFAQHWAPWYCVGCNLCCVSSNCNWNCHCKILLLLLLLMLLLLLIVSFFQPYQTPCTWPVAAWKACAMACGCKYYNFTYCCCCCCCCWLFAVAVPVGVPIITIVGIFVAPHVNSLMQEFCLPNYFRRSYY